MIAPFFIYVVAAAEPHLRTVGDDGGSALDGQASGPGGGDCFCQNHEKPPPGAPKGSDCVCSDGSTGVVQTDGCACPRVHAVTPGAPCPCEAANTPSPVNLLADTHMLSGRDLDDARSLLGGHEDLHAFLGDQEETDADVPAEETKVKTTTDGIPAIMIAPQYLYDKKAPSLSELGFVPKHVMPVITQLNCVSGSKYMTGCYLAHMNAWDVINRTRQMSLIIEADWTTAKRSFADTKTLLNGVLKEYNAGNKELISVGGCTQFGIPHVCTTAYFMTPEGADKMLRLSQGDKMCPHSEPLDDTFRVLCTHIDEKTKTTRLSCYEAPNAPDLGQTSKIGEKKNGEWLNAYGQGIFQQDRVNLRGMHVKGNSVKEARRFHDTYDTPDAVN